MLDLDRGSLLVHDRLVLGAPELHALGTHRYVHRLELLEDVGRHLEGQASLFIISLLLGVIDRVKDRRPAELYLGAVIRAELLVPAISFHGLRVDLGGLCGVEVLQQSQGGHDS